LDEGEDVTFSHEQTEYLYLSLVLAIELTVIASD